jgi:hypothetical protein
MAATPTICLELLIPPNEVPSACVPTFAQEQVIVTVTVDPTAAVVMSVGL